ncbi:MULTISPECIES: NADAR family protein [Niastella]|uniref:NADAR family protein n=1 Tax=Niastella soli TaxID=2821487 RepID=A0ABS3YNC7_9BACT|nr:NADAR family protein [Niastella soli]MBO9199318.1 NADAR family protein [Niastella soli]
MKYSIAWLKEQVAKGVAVKYNFFWGHTPKIPGVTDKSCLSQWFPAAFTVEGITYPTAEHWMMAEKARLFKDEEALEKILNSSKPGTAKALGRTVRNFDKAVWEAKAYHIVVEGSVRKFSQNESLKNFLLTTGNTIIVEASPRDRIWGIGLGQERAAEGPHVWRGKNWLGFALMEARDKLNTN